MMGRFRPFLFPPVLQAGVRAIPPLLLDNFTGTGALTAHTPDTCPSGASWAIVSGTWGNLSAGFLPYTSGTYGAALINVGASDFELSWRAKHMLGGNGVFSSGMYVRANATNSDKYGIGTYQYPAGGQSYLLGPLMYDAQTLLQGAVPLNLTVGNYYTWRLLLKGTQARVYNEAGSLVAFALNLAKTSNSYVGPGCQQPGGNWDWLRLQTVFSRPWMTISILGDSISNDTNEWPGYLSAIYNNGYCEVFNHALPGSQIAYHMDPQTDQAEADQADMTIIALGTNDGAGSAATQAEYCENLMELWGTLGKPIYCMGVLPKSPGEAERISINAYLQEAVAAAVTAGANAMFWNTDGWIDPATDTSDGLHPNAAGQKKIAAAAKARLEGN